MSNVNVQVQRDIGHSGARVWAILGDFGNMSWTVGTERVELVGSGVGMMRRLFMPGMAEPIEEILQSIDPVARTFSYTIPRIPMPVSDYAATVRVEELGPGRSRVHWSATGNAQGVEPAQAAKIIGDTYAMMLGWLEDALASD